MCESAIKIVAARMINQCPLSNFISRRRPLDVFGGDKRGEAFCDCLVKFNNFLLPRGAASGGTACMVVAIIFKAKMMNVVFGDRLFIIAS